MLMPPTLTRAINAAPRRCNFSRRDEVKEDARRVMEGRGGERMRELGPLVAVKKQKKKPQPCHNCQFVAGERC